MKTDNNQQGQTPSADYAFFAQPLFQCPPPSQRLRILKQRLFSSFLACFIVLLAACGGGSSGDNGAPPVDTNVQGSIGPNGGTVVHGTGASVEIPAGALASTVEILISTDTASAPAIPATFRANGKAYALLPHGTTFSTPVTVSIPFDTALVPSGAAPRLFKAEPGGSFVEIPASVVGDKLVAQVSSFSFFQALGPPPSLTWVDEPLDPSISAMAVGPDGIGMFFGYPKNGVAQLAIRPVGGPIGAPQVLPAAISTPSVLGFAPNGDAILAYGWSLAFRPAGAASAVETPQLLPPGIRFIKTLAVTTTGAALVGTDDFLASNGSARIASRPAGAAALVDAANIQTFTSATPGGYVQLIGLALDPDGGAVAVLTGASSTGLVQAVRASGETLFHEPTPIENPADITGGRRAAFAYAQDGHAVLAWIGSSLGHSNDSIVVTQRSPGGAFDAPKVIATTSIFDFNTVTPVMTAGGDGMVVWDRPTFIHSPGLDGNSGCRVDFQLMASMLHDGLFAMPIALSQGLFPNTSDLLSIAGAGDRVAVAIQNNDLGDPVNPCNSADDKFQDTVQIYRSGANGLELEDNHIVASSPEGISSLGLHLGTTGTVMVGKITADGTTVVLHVGERK